ncbi:MAG: hypothetical protein ABW252_25805 [Polyangiales bacterium]
MSPSNRLLGLLCVFAAAIPVSAATAQSAQSSAWVAKVQTKAIIVTPLAANVPADLSYTVRIGAPDANGDSAVELCALGIGSSQFRFDPTKMLKFLKGSVTLPAIPAASGEAVAIPTIEIPVGIDAAGKATDVDEDKKAGVTMVASALGLLNMDVYVGIKFSLALDAKVQSADALAGNATFGVSGDIFGSSFPLLGPGKLEVKQTTVPQPFTAQRIAADQTCAQIVAAR